MRKRRQRSTRRTRFNAAPTSLQRLCLLRRRPSSDRMSGARPGGPCRSVGGQVPGARRVSPASHSEPARRLLDGDAEPRAGRPHVEPTDVYSCPPQEGGYSPRGASYRRIEGGGELRTATPVVAPNSMPAVWRRGPRLVNVASGLAHRSAQHLTPLRGRPPAERQKAMEREGAEVLVQGPKL